jgi:hypothetical protein
MNSAGILLELDIDLRSDPAGGIWRLASVVPNRAPGGGLRQLQESHRVDIDHDRGRTARGRGDGKPAPQQARQIEAASRLDDQAHAVASA